MKRWSTVGLVCMLFRHVESRSIIVPIPSIRGATIILGLPDDDRGDEHFLSIRKY